MTTFASRSSPCSKTRATRPRKTPIVICTGDNVEKERAQDVFGVLQKPFDLEAMLAVVKEACAVRAS